MTGRQLWVATSTSHHAIVDCPDTFDASAALDAVDRIVGWAPVRVARLADDDVLGDVWVIDGRGDLFATARGVCELVAHRQTLDMFAWCACGARVDVGHDAHDAGVDADGVERFACPACRGCVT